MQMKMTVVLLPLFTLVACPGGAPTAEDIDTAAQQVRLGVDMARRGHAALDLLSRLPLFTCGEERPVFAGRLADQARAQWSCAQVTAHADDQADHVTVLFPEPGCTVEGRRLSGPLRLRLSGGRDRFSADADLTELQVDGVPLRVSAGYKECAGERGVWAATMGTLPERPGSQYQLQLQAVLSPAPLPILVRDKVVLDGSGTVSGVGETFHFSLQGLTFPLGKPLPKEGVVQIETGSGRRVQATFSELLWVLSQVEIRIDDHEPVVVPL
jgi:hypothetical protein